MLGALSRFRQADPAHRARMVRSKLQRIVGALRSVFRPVGPTYWAYRPDAEWLSVAHPEISGLLERWTAGNRLNNAGDLPRLIAIVLNVKRVLADQVPGDFAELGVYRGNSAAVLAHFAAGAGRKVLLFDTFEGFRAEDLVGVDEVKPSVFADTSIDFVRSVVGHDETCVYIPGNFPDSISDGLAARHFAFVHLDCDLYRPMRDALAFFYERLNQGGMLFVHDYASGEWAGATQALDEFCRQTGERPILLPDKSGTAVIRKR